MRGLPASKDAYGRAMLDHFESRRGWTTTIERDDGLIDADFGMDLYFAPFSKWSPFERKALRLVRGRVLDVGAGAGRHALYLQERGYDVVAIDNSPLAVRVCRARGVTDARVVPFTQVSARLGVFDTVVMLGNNFGLFGSFARARWMLRRLKRLTSADARIVAQTLDPYATEEEVHLAYHRRNRRRGRMSGQARIRVRYKDYATPWFDYLFVSPEELRALVERTGWVVERLISAPGSPIYVAVLEKD